jgi:hypothetical protein
MNAVRVTVRAWTLDLHAALGSWLPRGCAGVWSAAGSGCGAGVRRALSWPSHGSASTAPGARTARPSERPTGRWVVLA